MTDEMKLPTCGACGGKLDNTQLSGICGTCASGESQGTPRLHPLDPFTDEEIDELRGGYHSGITQTCHGQDWEIRLINRLFDTVDFWKTKYEKIAAENDDLRKSLNVEELP